jgi:hypothetical protein
LRSGRWIAKFLGEKFQKLALSSWSGNFFPPFNPGADRDVKGEKNPPEEMFAQHQQQMSVNISPA